MSKLMTFKGGCPAIYKLGKGRNEDDYIDVQSKNEDYYISSFFEGFGFIDVKFKNNIGLGII